MAVELTVERQKNLTSVGSLTFQLQAAPWKIKELAHALGLTPCLALNGIAYFSEEQADALREQLSAEREAAG